jgi:hypothetical protein
MKTMSVVFSKSTSPYGVFSWLIMWAEKTPYSHVSIRIMDEETQLPVYYQASHTMVNCMGEPEWLSQEQIIYKFDYQVDDSIQKSVKAFSIGKLGVGYGVLSVFGLACVQIMKCFGKTINNPFKEVGATYVCSQFVAALLENANVPALEQIDLDNVTPADLYNIVKDLPLTLLANKV